jgi:hypothetical protein
MGKAMLIVVLGISLVAGKSLTGLNERSLPLSQSAAKQYESLLARNIASSGANMAISRLFQNPEWRDGLGRTNFGGGEFNATVTGSDEMIEVTATGKYGKTQKTVKVKLLSSSKWPYVIYANNEVDFSIGKGTITGDVHANYKVKIGDRYVLHGASSEAPPMVNPPTVNWDFFANQAKAAGQYVVGDKTFTAFGSPYTGVWYITNTAKIENNAVINGTIVAGNDCRLTGNNVSSIITAQENYPALVAKNSIIVEKNNAEISGFVYAGNGFKVNLNNLTVIGAITACAYAFGSGNNTDIIYDETYATNVAGIDFNSSGHTSLQILSWQEK